MSAPTAAECRVCRRPLTRSAVIGPKCLARELAAHRPAFPPAAPPSKRLTITVSRPTRRSRTNSPFPGQLDLTELETANA